MCLENLRRELLEKHRSELENLQNQFKKELAQQKAELEKVFQAKNQAECESLSKMSKSGGPGFPVSS